MASIAERSDNWVKIEPIYSEVEGTSLTPSALRMDPTAADASTWVVIETKEIKYISSALSALSINAYGNADVATVKKKVKDAAADIATVEAIKKKEEAGEPQVCARCRFFLGCRFCNSTLALKWYLKKHDRPNPY